MMMMVCARLIVIFSVFLLEASRAFVVSQQSFVRYRPSETRIILPDTVSSPFLLVQGRHYTDLKFTNDEESEWYSPPPTGPPKPAELVDMDPQEQIVYKLPKGVTPKVTVIRSKMDLEEFLQEDDRLCIVKFHAAWCKSCQKFNLHFQKLINQYADWEKDGQVLQENKVRIAEVEWGANTQLCKALGVKKLPSLYFYSGGIKVADMAAGPTKFGLVRAAVQHYTSLRPEELQFEARLELGKKLVEEAERRERFEEVARAREQRRAGTTSRVVRKQQLPEM